MKKVIMGALAGLVAAAALGAGVAQAQWYGGYTPVYVPSYNGGTVYAPCYFSCPGYNPYYQHNNYYYQPSYSYPQSYYGGYASANVYVAVDTWGGWYPYGGYWW